MPKQVVNVAADDYLTAIYRISHDEGQDVIAVRLADRLAITPPSVAGMLKRLQRDGLVSLDSKKVIHLSAIGRARAEEMVRRHRLAECLLTEVLNLDWWRAYEEAHLLEHGLSEVTEPLLLAALSNPTRSPFGYPIPGPDSPPMSMLHLADIEEGSEAVVERVYEEDEKLLRFFHDEGFLPDRPVHVRLVEPYRGTMTVQLEGDPVVIGTQVAEQIWVTTAN